ncbi:Slp family lipoprotein [Petrachloros mirabilis]
MKILVMTMMALWLAGCVGVLVVPPDLKEKVDRSVTFQQVKTSPSTYEGRLIVVGGVVLSAKPLKENGTRIEILQLPLDSDDEPVGQLTESKGRFLARHKEFLDPATIPFGTRVTVVGEVTGSMTLKMDEVDYEYPTLDIASLTVWPPEQPAYWSRPYPYFGAYWGSFWGPYWGPPQWIAWPVQRK